MYGLSVAFAFALAALLSGRLDAAWAPLVTPVDNRRLGEPDAGYCPWRLVGLSRAGLGWLVVLGPCRKRLAYALVGGHGAVALFSGNRKRGLFKSWTVLLAIFAFSLSLMGTFLVRSGVLTSVHAFASDPERGMFILALLGLCGSVALGIRHRKRRPCVPLSRYDWISRESFATQ